VLPLRKSEETRVFLECVFDWFYNVCLLSIGDNFVQSGGARQINRFVPGDLVALGGV